jgi:two-component system, OmpR family, response regulator ChvI
MGTGFRIALIDDEEGLRRTLGIALENSGYLVDGYVSASDALEAMARPDVAAPDLIVLDVMMPGIDGITFCSIFRKDDRKTPIVFLTSRADELTRLEALERGGDDYLTKPFSIKELLVRIAVCLKRIERYAPAEAAACHGAPAFDIDYPAWRVRFGGRPIDFTVTEFRIFTALYSRPGAVMTREKMMERAYPEDPYVSDRNADMHVARIRKKIRALRPDFDGIETVYGLGYRFLEGEKG